MISVLFSPQMWHCPTHPVTELPLFHTTKKENVLLELPSCPIPNTLEWLLPAAPVSLSTAVRYSPSITLSDLCLRIISEPRVLYQFPFKLHNWFLTSGPKLWIILSIFVGTSVFPSSGFRGPESCSYLVNVSRPIIVDFHLSIQVLTLERSSHDVRRVSWPSSRTKH